MGAMLGSPYYLVLLVTAAFTSITANSLLRLGLKKSGIESLSPAYLIKNLFAVVLQPYVLAGFLLFVVSAVLWMRVLTMESLSKSYPMLVGIMMVLLTVSSVVVLHESLSLTRIAGMVFIALGTILIFIKA